jgi:hypothetical protein
LPAGTDSVNEPSACTRAAVIELVADTARTAIAPRVNTLPVNTWVDGALVQPNPATAQAASSQGLVMFLIEGLLWARW